MKNIISTFTCSFLIPALILVLSSPASAQQLAVIDGEIVAFEDASTALWVSEKVVAPQYPMKALRRGLGGCVAIGFVIDADGTTSNHRVLANSDTGTFNYSAIEAAKQFLYQPTELNPGRAPVIVSNTFTYQINPSKKTGEKNRKELSEECSSAAKQALQPLLGSSEEG